jgi:hypothetical protein
MSTPEQQTCGKGLAENSVLPATLSHLISAMAKNLEVHMQALVLTDSNSQVEHNAYEKLVNELRRIAVDLQMAANEMSGYRDLPMGRHDEVAMTQPEVAAAFEKFVQHKQELLSLLEQTAERDNQLLETMNLHMQQKG